MCEHFLFCSTLLFMCLSGQFWENKTQYTAVLKNMPNSSIFFFALFFFGFGFFFFSPRISKNSIGSSKALLHRSVVTRQAEPVQHGRLLKMQNLWPHSRICLGTRFVDEPIGEAKVNFSVHTCVPEEVRAWRVTFCFPLTTEAWDFIQMLLH